ncbi:MAG: enoyl-CoA hydratase/isomerase family protein, partial [Chloroflexi bacterium]|nr:enoyl-CoA hydratase/isomerase family protein [Chloroflexota bacterium]
ILAGSGNQQFARVASFGDAIYFVLTGEAMTAEEALRIGFVREVVEPDRLMPRAIEIAKTISANAPLAVQASKKVMHHWRRFAMEESQKFTDSIYAGIRASEDAKEGPRAFAEKRPAQWKAR